MEESKPDLETFPVVFFKQLSHLKVLQALVPLFNRGRG